MIAEAAFQYLNLENRWPDFELDKLIIEAGSLKLASVLGQAQVIGPELGEAVDLGGPAGIGVDPAGNIYLADPAHHQIIRIDACDGTNAPLPCLRGPGQEPGELNSPRGLVIGPQQTLYIADSDNHRIQLIDLPTQQLRAIWGQADPFSPPQPGTEPGELNEPWDLALDQAGCLYVVDHGNRRVQKFDRAGRVECAFWETMAAQAQVPIEPTYIIVMISSRNEPDSRERLLIIDSAVNRLLVYRTDGSFDPTETARWAGVTTAVGQLRGVAFDGTSLYVGDSSTGRILVFNQAGVFVGIAHDFQQPLAGLALDKQGRLLVHPGGQAAVQRLEPASARVLCGTFLAGPFEAGPRVTNWQRLQLLMEALPEGCHLRLFTYTSDTRDGSGGRRPALPLTCENSSNSNSALTTSPATAADLTGLDNWRPAPPDTADLLILNQPGRYLWLAGLIQGDGLATPTIHQIKVNYDHETWLRFLPVVLHQDAEQRVLLERTVTLFESLLTDQEAAIDSLPTLFDPWAAPDDTAPDGWLDWLAGWLALELDERWSPAKRRQAVADAFTLYARRGTIDSLRGLIRLYSGATAHIREPARDAGLWALDGEQSILGFTTMLAPAEPQGAVVGTTATLDASHLIRDEDYGAPLFEDLAHRFCVQVYAADLPDPNALDQVQAVIDREKPAHTDYHLCLIEARMRVGFQARLGVDTIVGGTAADLVFDETVSLGFGTILPADGAAQSRLGQQARLGRRTTLT